MATGDNFVIGAIQGFKDGIQNILGGKTYHDRGGALKADAGSKKFPEYLQRDLTTGLSGKPQIV